MTRTSANDDSNIAGIRRTLGMFLAVTVAASFAGCAPAVEQVTTPARQPGVLDVAELENWADSFFEEQLEELKIPGAVFAFVREGRVILAKGYGIADLESETAVDPDETIMRIGSTSKLIVATAVMQLVELGQIDLHTDVNEYLTTFQVGDEFDDPVTMAHLLTHSAGFDHPLYWTTTDLSEILPLGQYLAEQMPPRILPPGEVLGYSSQGYDLAAFIVEEISGVPFDEYAERNILLPLGMDSSSFLLTPPYPENLATGYALEGQTQIPQEIDYDPGYPSGSLVTTASDMAKLMLAYLGDGCYRDTCILSAESIALMQQQHFTNHPQLPGWTYGFTEGFRNNLRLIGHGGAIRGFGSDLTLVPDYELGYFMAFNEECYLTGACAIVGRLRSQFLDRFFPAEVAEPPEYESETDLDRLIGTYRYIRYPHSEIYQEEYAPYTPYDVEVTSSQGHIVVYGSEYQEIGPLLFQHVDGQALIAFREDALGNVIYMFSPDTHERID
jgi:CubicO group peptidase (beta-lactamase class C family)